MQLNKLLQRTNGEDSMKSIFWDVLILIKYFFYKTPSCLRCLCLNHLSYVCLYLTRLLLMVSPAACGVFTLRLFESFPTFYLLILSMTHFQSFWRGLITCSRTDLGRPSNSVNVYEGVLHPPRFCAELFSAFLDWLNTLPVKPSFPYQQSFPQTKYLFINTGFLETTQRWDGSNFDLIDR